MRDAADPHRIGVVVGTWPSGKVSVHWTGDDSTEDIDRSRLLLDLSDATGRIHAAWWIDRQHPPADADTRWFERRRGWLMGGTDAEGLRDACLHVAGRGA